MLKEILLNEQCALEERTVQYTTELDRFDKALKELEGSDMSAQNRQDIKCYLAGIREKNRACLDIAKKRLIQVNGFLEKFG